MDFRADRFIAHEQVHPTIVVKISPGRRLGRVQGEQTGLFGSVDECSISLVVQQRVGIAPKRAEPGPAQDQDVGVAIVVVVCQARVQSTHNTHQPRFLSVIRKGPISLCCENSGSGRVAPRKKPLYQGSHPHRSPP